MTAIRPKGTVKIKSNNYVIHFTFEANKKPEISLIERPGFLSLLLTAFSCELCLPRQPS